MGSVLGYVHANRVSSDAGLSWLPDMPLPFYDKWNLPCARCVTSCYLIPFLAIPTHTIAYNIIHYCCMLCHTIPYHPMPYILSDSIPCHPMTFYSMPCHAISCYVLEVHLDGKSFFYIYIFIHLHHCFSSCSIPFVHISSHAHFTTLYLISFSLSHSITLHLTSLHFISN